jgi:hypothetical protein
MMRNPTPVITGGLMIVSRCNPKYVIITDKINNRIPEILSRVFICKYDQSYYNKTNVFLI